MPESPPTAPTVKVITLAGGTRLELSGNWTKDTPLPELPKTEGTLAWKDSGLGSFDSALPAWIQAVERARLNEGQSADRTGLPARLLKWLGLSHVDAEIPTPAPRMGQVERIGDWALNSRASWARSMAHLGETTLAFARLAVGNARVNWAEFPRLVRAAGPDALPITLLLGFLTGVIMAYVGLIQLSKVGADMYVANLVGLAMAREMGALMTGVVACGRTSTAYASHLGSMNVSQEADALRVLGIQPVEYLATPRILAVLLVLPILALFATLAGILGGMAVACGAGMSAEQYINQVIDAVSVRSFLVGEIKAVAFSFIVAWSGCYRGSVAAPNARGVGEAATTAAVLGITLLVVCDAIFAVIFNLYDFN